VEINGEELFLQHVLFEDNGCSGCALIEEWNCVELVGHGCYDRAVWVKLNKGDKDE
jgi:hypothetical protein